MIDWRSICDSHRIDYVEGGKGWIAVHCPFCGAADPSQHMNVKDKSWHCWRNQQHRGRDPVKLLAALLHLGYMQARAILGPEFVTMPDDFGSAIRSKLMPQKQMRESLELPEEFRQISDVYNARRFVEYLEQRGFLRSQIFRMTQDYGMYYAISGPLHGRIIFTIWDKDDLIGYTGRTVYKNNTLRYKTEGSTGHLLWFDKLMKSEGNIICLVEGPFDALKINLLGERGSGIVATCAFTSAPTETQVDLLHTLLPRFQRRIIILDRGSEGPLLNTYNRLRHLGVEKRRLQPAFKDPAELSAPALYDLVRREEYAI